MHEVPPHGSTALPARRVGCSLVLPIPSRRRHGAHCGAYATPAGSAEPALISLWDPAVGIKNDTYPQCSSVFPCAAVAKPALLSDFEALYSLGDTVGAGSQSLVYACHLRLSQSMKLGNHQLEQKTLCVKHMLEETVSVDAFNCVMKLDHPNIVRHYCLYRDARGLWVVMDYIRGPELLTLLQQKGGRFSEATCKKVCRQVMAAIECVHKQNLVHCDIKLENFVVTNQGLGHSDAEDDAGHISIALVDFGSAEVAGTPRRTDLRDASSGTLMYLAPERFFDAPADSKGDMWAAGIMLCILLTGKPLFGEVGFLKCTKQHLDLSLECTAGAEGRRVMDNCRLSPWTFGEHFFASDNLAAIENRVEETFRQPEWLAVSAAAKRLIKRLIRIEPSKRLSATDALQDPWLADRMDKSV